MSIHVQWTVEGTLAALDEHLYRTRGVCPGTRRNCARYAGAFLETVFADGPVDPGRIRVGDVVDFVGALTRRYRPATVELAATALRSFFRFLRAEGMRATGWRTRRRWRRTVAVACLGIWTRRSSLA